MLVALDAQDAIALAVVAAAVCWLAWRLLGGRGSCGACPSCSALDDDNRNDHRAEEKKYISAQMLEQAAKDLRETSADAEDR